MDYKLRRKFFSTIFEEMLFNKKNMLYFDVFFQRVLTFFGSLTYKMNCLKYLIINC